MAHRYYGCIIIPDTTTYPHHTTQHTANFRPSQLPIPTTTHANEEGESRTATESAAHANPMRAGRLEGGVRPPTKNAYDAIQHTGGSRSTKKNKNGRRNGRRNLSESGGEVRKAGGGDRRRTKRAERESEEEKSQGNPRPQRRYRTRGEGENAGKTEKGRQQKGDAD